MKIPPPARLALACILPLCAGMSCNTMNLGSASVVHEAKSWNGKHFRHGSTRQCANWVTHVVAEAGKTPPPASSLSRSWMNYGKPVPKADIRPGDVLVFANTYRGGISHVGIALNENEFIHRSTWKSPVKISPMGRYEVASVRRG